MDTAKAFKAPTAAWVLFLAAAPDAYKHFGNREDGRTKTVFQNRDEPALEPRSKSLQN